MASIVLSLTPEIILLLSNKLQFAACDGDVKADKPKHKIAAQKNFNDSNTYFFMAKKLLPSGCFCGGFPPFVRYVTSIKKPRFFSDGWTGYCQN